MSCTVPLTVTWEKTKADCRIINVLINKYLCVIILELDRLLNQK